MYGTKYHAAGREVGDTHVRNDEIGHRLGSFERRARSDAVTVLSHFEKN